jgi:hypothetical protein
MNHQHKPTNVKKGRMDCPPQPHQRFRAVGGLILLIAVCCCTRSVHAFRVTDPTDLGFGGGILRWDAAPNFIDGVERSLDGGLRYSVEGGSYAAFRDRFRWAAPAPTVAEFQTVVEQSFAAWEVVDPESGLGTDLYFVPDFDTPIVIETASPDLAGRFILNRGAEIDLVSGSLGDFLGKNESYGDPNADSITLTSGIANYPATVISGVDITMNFIDPSIRGPWQGLVKFQQILTHEIGHALGLYDVDVDIDFGISACCGTRFYDDNYDDTSSATALATLTNSFAGVIDPFDPDNSPSLMLTDVCEGTGTSLFDCTGDPGIDTPGVTLLMETSPTPGETWMGLQNDEYAGRQFLYPHVIPEPSTLFMAYIAGCALLQRRRQN